MFIAEHADHQVGGLRWESSRSAGGRSEHGCPIALPTYYDARAAAARPHRRGSCATSS